MAKASFCTRLLGKWQQAANYRLREFKMPDESKTQETLRIESAVFQRLLEHLRKRADVQNIDLMVLADFCRNCLAKWYVKAAKDENVTVSYDQARERIYGMPYQQWKEKHQTPMTPEQEKAFSAREKK